MEFFCKSLKKPFQFETEHQSISEVFRNYFTVIPQQNLLDDLLDDSNEQEKLQSIIDGMSGIEKDNDYCSRPFRYAKVFPEISSDDVLKPFQKDNVGQYGIGRYGDGYGYGVFYSALDIETSVKETLFHTINDFNNRQSKMEEENFIRDRKMIKVGFSGKLLNIADSQFKDLKSEITGESYSACHKLGAFCVSKNIDAIKVPSARTNGNCLPIFNQDSIKNFNLRTSFIFNFQIIISKKDPSTVLVREINTQTFKSDEIVNFKRVSAL